MGLVLCIAGLLGTALVARRSLGHALGLLLAIGSVYGIVRANVYDGIAHFLFDASVLGFYLGCWRILLQDPRDEFSRIRLWVFSLCALPFVLILFSPFIDSQPVLIQLIGLRPAMFFVPLLLAGAKLDRPELGKVGSWAAGVALGTALFALGEFLWGLGPFFPLNRATELIYRSKDVGEEMVHRIPATFVSAHAYGGTMVALLPLLTMNLERGRRWVIVGTCALIAAALGVFACAARLPVVALALVGLVLALSGESSRRVRLAAVVVAGALLLIVPYQSRLQRFETLSDSEYVGERVRGSVNMGFLEAAFDHPLGTGLSSAVGTSVPYFLEGIARPQYGMENEYARICLEEGIPGVLLWVGFVAWVLVADPRRVRRFGGTFEAGAWVVCVLAWFQGAVGTGMLASVPVTMLLFLYMGVLAAQREAQTAEARLVAGRATSITLETADRNA